ncbi:MAG: sulfatase, partial [Planctomycetota bacterium]
MRTPLRTLRPGLLLAPYLLFVGLASCSGGAGDAESTEGAGTPAAAAGKQRPVILISIDSLRADYTTPYGHVPRFAPEEQTTPFLSWMAEQGVLFEHASASSPWTLPSHMTLLTGMSPMEHGVRSRKYSLDKGIDLVSNVFQGAGYHTGGFFTAPFLHPAWGFGRGFDVYVPSADYLGTIEAGQVLSAAGKSPEVVELHTKSHTDARTGEQAIDRAITWLAHEDRHQEPFFLFLHLWDPHYDYFPPQEYADRFLPDYTGDIVGDEFLDLERDLSERDLHDLQALYEAEIRYTDDQIARLHAQLEEWGVADDVILAVVSDHGDEFMEHGNRGHHLTLLEEVMHVPMVVHAPGLIDGGTRVQGSVSIRDLAP